MWPFNRKTEQRQSIENPSVPLSSPFIINMLGGSATSEAGIAVNRETAVACAPVWAAVSFIARSIAGLPLKVYTRSGDGREEYSGPIFKVLHDSPGPDLTSFDWRKMMMTDLLLTGRHISFIVRNGRNQIVQIVPIPRQKVHIERKNGVKTYSYTPPEGQKQTLSATDVIDLVWMYQQDNLTEVDPITRMKDAIGLYMALEGYASKFFQNGGIPPLQLKGNVVSVEGARRASDDITRAIAAASKEQRNVLVMPAGYELAPIGGNPAEMQMESARMFQLGEIARVFGLPRVFLQDLSQGTYSNTEQQDLHFVKHTLTAWVRQIEQELNLKLFGKSSEQYAEFSVDGLLRGDFKTRMEGYRSAVNTAIMTPNEVRQRENLPAMETGNDLLIQGATVPLGSQPVEPAQPELTNDGGQDGEDGA